MACILTYHSWLMTCLPPPLGAAAGWDNSNRADKQLLSVRVTLPLSLSLCCGTRVHVELFCACCLFPWVRLVLTHSVNLPLSTTSVGLDTCPTMLDTFTEKTIK